MTGYNRLRAAVAALMVIPLISAPALAAPAGEDLKRPLHEDTSVPVQSVPVKPEPAVAATRGPSKVSWPKPVSIDVKPQGGVAPVPGTPISVGPEGNVHVEVRDRAATAAAGVTGVLFTVRRAESAPVDVEVDYSGFRDAFGGGWANRLRLVSLPSCAAVTPDRAECRRTTPVESANNGDTQRISAKVVTGTEGGVFAVTAEPDGATGDFKATPMSPTSSWQVGMNSGTFGWSYPLRVPAVPGGLQPDVKLAYSSGAIDGRTAAMNNQASWAGDGWDLASSFITRTYRPCADEIPDLLKKIFDQCWDTGDYVSMMLNGKSVNLIKSGNRWRPDKDDGSWVETVGDPAWQSGTTGNEHWKVTTVDGTQYFFGSKPAAKSKWTIPVFGNTKGEPCHVEGDLGKSWCDQGWRWNLDYVVDRHGNTMTYTYETETNHYGLNVGNSTEDYIRSGNLRLIEYGKAGNDGKPLARVDFDTEDRCAPGTDCTKRDMASWPDVPWDQSCDGDPCKDKYSPTFWSTKRLAKVTSQILQGGEYKPVDSWALGHTFLKPGDRDDAALWLQSITHTGLANGKNDAMPPITFDGTPLPNRIDTTSDGLPPLNRHRLSAIHNETGGVMHVNYLPADCQAGAFPKPEDNKQRCFPVHWGFLKGGPRDDWFNKYVVDNVVQEDRVGGGLPQVTSYRYLDGGAWHYDDNQMIEEKMRTWSQWRGYGKVIVRKGDPAPSAGTTQTEQEYRYFRGMHGDRLTKSGGTKNVQVEDSKLGKIDDNAGLEGFTREEIVRNGPGGAEVSGKIIDPWRKETASARGSRIAVLVRDAKEVSRVARTAQADRVTEVSKEYDDRGYEITKNDRGDLNDATDDRCTRTEYVHNDGIWVLGKVHRVETVGVTCGAPVDYAKDAISEERTSYDGKAWGQPPDRGLVTRVEKARSYRGSVPELIEQTRATFDGYGRKTEAFDALNRLTATRYEPAEGIPARTFVTDAMGNVTASDLDPARGLTVKSVDVNGLRTDQEYDGLGRLTEVWKPGRSRDAREGGHLRFKYLVRRDGASATETQKLTPDNAYVSGFELVDGFQRARQTQSAAWGGGRVIVDTTYDTRGLVVRKTKPFYNADAAPGTQLVRAADNEVPAATVSTFDGAERETKVEQRERDEPKRVTTTEYRGDHTVVVPPVGDTTKSTFTDARGNMTELRQFRTRDATGTPDVTQYRYDKAGRLSELTDPAQNKTAHRYDLLGNRLWSDDPDKGVTEKKFDNAGQVTEEKDARGGVRRFSYDNAGKKTEARDGADVLLAKWSYDKGRLITATRYVSGKEYTVAHTAFDVAGRPKTVETRIPDTGDGVAGTYSVTRAYSPNGALQTATLSPLGNAPSETITYGYDGLGLLKSVRGLNEYVSDTVYTRFGEVSRIQQGGSMNRMWHTMYYEYGNRRLSQAWVDRQRPTDDEVEGRSYEYDQAGNIMKIATTSARAGTDVQCFTYDYLRRNRDAWTSTSNCAGGPGSSVGGVAPYWTTFDYDLVGNRTVERKHGMEGAADVVRTYNYPRPTQRQPHAVQSVVTNEGSQPYSHDPMGNTLGRPGPDGKPQTLTWDIEGQLESVTTDGKKTTHVYSADGERLITRDAAGTTLHLADGQLRFDSATKAKTGTRYYTHGKQEIAVRTGRALSYQAGDQHGTGIVALAADTLEPTWRKLDQFGQPRDAAAVAFPGSRGFVGGTKDDSTGLTRLGARDYDASTGRFLAVDPLAVTDDPQSLNGFAYSKNNPATFHDRTGLIWEECYYNPSWCKDPEPTPPPVQPGGAGGGTGGSTGGGQKEKPAGFQNWNIPSPEQTYREAWKQAQKMLEQTLKMMAEMRKKLNQPVTSGLCANWGAGGFMGLTYIENEACLHIDWEGIGWSTSLKKGLSNEPGLAAGFSLMQSNGTIDDQSGHGLFVGGSIPLRRPTALQLGSTLSLDTLTYSHSVGLTAGRKPSFSGGAAWTQSGRFFSHMDVINWYAEQTPALKWLTK